MAVAVDQQSHGFKSFGRPPRCRLQSYSHLECTMPQLSQTTNNNFSDSFKQPFFEAPNNNNNIHRSSSTPCLPLATSMEEEECFHRNPRIEITGGNGDPRARALAVEVAIALASGAFPVPVTTGLSGAYFLRGRNSNTIAVVKPVDEEPLAFNNPKGFTGMNIRAGETGLRELAAYLLDHGGFSGVPPTALVKISHVAFHVNHSEAESQPPPPPYKFASLQRFVDHDFDAGDLGPSGFSVSSIHSIGILDVRLLNLDRHAGNMLVKQGRENYAVGAAELVPIDHGLCLPESLDDPYFEWLHWPQASVPFTESESEYIRNLNPLEDAELLRIKVPSIRESSIRVLVLCTVFLQRAAAAGLCLADIGEMMTREFCRDDNLSELERLCLNAKTVMSSISNESFDNCNQSKEEERDQESEMFQLDNEGKSQGSDLPPQLLSRGSSALGKPPRIPRASTAVSITRLFDSPNNNIHKDDDNIIFNSNDDNDSSGSGGGYGGGGRGSGGVLIRSMTFSESNNYHKHESGGGIILGEMSEEEWELFLESFEKLLPEAFEGTKCLTKKKKKQRLGTPWEF